MEILVGGNSSIVKSLKKLKVSEDAIEESSPACTVVVTSEEVKDIAEN